MGPFEANTYAINTKLSELNKLQSPGSPIDANTIKEQLLSEDEVLKIMIIEQSSNNPDERIGDDTADLIIKSYPENHPTRTWIKDKKKELIASVEQLGVKYIEIYDGSIQLTTETISSFVTIGSSVAVMPLGAGIPTAFSAVQSVLSSLQAFQTKINQLQPILDPLKYASLLLPENAVSSINVPLGAVNNVLAGVTPIISMVGEVKQLLGNTSVPGVNADPKEIQATMTANVGEHIRPGKEVLITVEATQGKWQYKYLWSASNDSNFVSSNQKSQTVYPTRNTTYTCNIKNKDDSGSGKICSIDITTNMEH